MQAIEATKPKPVLSVPSLESWTGYINQLTTVFREFSSLSLDIEDHVNEDAQFVWKFKAYVGSVGFGEGQTAQEAIDAVFSAAKEKLARKAKELRQQADDMERALERIDNF